MRLLIFHPRLRVPNFWLYSTFGYMLLMSPRVATRRLWLLLWMLAACMSTWSYS
jgi:hypothetical protein